MILSVLYSLTRFLIELVVTRRQSEAELQA